MSNRRSRPKAIGQSGVTLIEMLMVVVIISLMVGIAVPAFQAGLPAIRLRSAASSVAQLLHAARNQVERDQTAVLLEVDPARRMLRFRPVSGEGGEELELPTGVGISAVYPTPLGSPPVRREFLFLPGGSPPPIAIELENDRDAHKTIRLDPITLSPLIEDQAPQRKP